MPITQQRMINLINAASDYEQAFNQAVSIISRINKQARDNQLSIPEALLEIDQAIRHVGLLVHPIDSSKIIALERAHFKSVARTNDKAANKQERKRRAEGRGQRQQNHGLRTQFLQHTPNRTTAPDEMARDAILMGSIYQQVHDTNQDQTPDQEYGRNNLYPDDPSLSEDDDLNPEDLLRLSPSTLSAETKQEIERIVEQLTNQDHTTGQ